MRHIYDRFARFYDRALAPLERAFLAQWRAETLAALPRHARVLEVGAGTGLNFAYYPEESTAQRPEISGEMIAKARENGLRPSEVHLVRSSVEHLPFPDGSFDAAFATLVFCSVVSPHDAFLELRRIVRPGGTIVLLEHVRPPGKFLGPAFDALSVITVSLFDDHFNRNTVLAAERSGLRIEHVTNRARGVVQTIICRV
ncbi:MAG: class I SAM-dependent methyltransferase [Pyrinomonadaceae bacterium]